MSLFTNSQGFEINCGQPTAATTVITKNNYLSGPTGIDILREASTLEAAHDSSTRSYPLRCFPGTREQYIEDIVHWASPSLGSTPPPMYWMSGPAGVGKSAVAQTCAEKLQKIGTLGAAFFFSVRGQRKAERFFPSIAYPLSTVHPAYRDLVDKRILHDKTLVDKAMQFQFQYLIDEPLRELEENGKGIRRRVQVFVDGLDECEGADAQCEIIRIVAAASPMAAFFSRPEPHLKAMFLRTDIAPHCHRVMLPISSDADGEIELYLRNGFDNILKRYNSSTQILWPSAEDMRTVVGAADGSFIHATTVIRFRGSPRSSRASEATDAPFAELDAFYVLILQRVPTIFFPSVYLLLAIMCRYENLGAAFSANLLGFSKDEFEAVCNHVGAVIHFEDPGKGLEIDPTLNTSCAYTQIGRDVLPELVPQISRHLGGQIDFYHKSFYDFLLDPARSGSYCVKTSEALAKHYVKIHLDYDRSFCWHGSELVLAPGVPDSAASLSYPHTTELVNSLLKAYVYVLIGEEDTFKFAAPQELNADRDFRKHLHIYTNLLDSGYVYSCPLWGCACRRKIFQGTYIDCVSHSRFPEFNVIEFESMTKQQERANIIRRYHPKLTSRIKSLFRNKSQEGVESVLYHMGRGEKSIFWYREINYKLQYYRTFRSIDLAEGEKIFQKEDFDSWPEFGHDPSPDRDEGRNEDGTGTRTRTRTREKTKTESRANPNKWWQVGGGGLK